MQELESRQTDRKTAIKQADTDRQIHTYRRTDTDTDGRTQTDKQAAKQTGKQANGTEDR